MKSLALACSICFVAVGFAQMSKSEKESFAYHTWRCRTTEPVYGLDRIKNLVAKLHEGKNMKQIGGGFGTTLPKATFEKLTLAEKFTYNMIFPEAFSQNCAGFMTEKGEEKRIYARPPGAFESEWVWSDGQRKWFKANRANVVPLLRETIKTKGDAGSNLKQAIILSNGFELIPDIVQLYKVDRKDNDLLSTLGCLMESGKYAPFVNSAIGRKLYSDKARYDASVDATEKNREVFLAQAMAYYKSKSKP